MKKNLLFALIASLAPLGAAAQVLFPPPPPREITPGPYLGASLGLAYNRTGCPDFIRGGGRVCDLRDPSFSGFAGWQLNRFFAGEAQYRYLGKVSSSGFGTTFSVQTSVLDATAIGRIPIYGERFFGYGRFGGYRAHLEPSDNTDAPSRVNYGFTYGLGVQWELLPQWAARADWQRYRHVGNNLLYGSSTYDALTLGVLYRLR
jgi:opacity protein-like surface antigen